MSEAREKCIYRGLKCKIVVIYATAAPEPSFEQDAPEIFSQTDGGQTARIGGVNATTWKPCLSCDLRNQHGLGEIEKDYRCQ